MGNGDKKERKGDSGQLSGAGGAEERERKCLPLSRGVTGAALGSADGGPGPAEGGQKKARGAGQPLVTACGSRPAGHPSPGAGSCLSPQLQPGAVERPERSPGRWQPVTEGSALARGYEVEEICCGSAQEEAHPGAGGAACFPQEPPGEATGRTQTCPG